MNQLKTNLMTILNEKTNKIIPENIKKDVQIFDIVGTLEAGTEINNQDKTITTNGTYTADEGYTGLGTVTVNVPSAGIDTSDATATSIDLVEGKTAYVNGEKIEGSLSVQSKYETGFSEKITDETTGLGDVTKLSCTSPNFNMLLNSTELTIPVLNTDLSEHIGLTPEKIVKGNTILGVTGTYDDMFYTPLMYIQSSGTQYINTEVKANSNIKIEADMQLVSANNDTALFGARRVIPNRLCLYTHQSNEIYYYYGNSEYLAYVEKNPLNRQTYVVNKNVLSVNGVTQITTPEDTFTTTDDIYIFAANGDDGAHKFSYTKLYSLKIWENDILIRYFIPVKKASTNEICLCDIVEGKFYYNAGTGDFIAGDLV